jgi:DNA-binding response OmpR family regulator
MVDRTRHGETQRHAGKSLGDAASTARILVVGGDPDIRASLSTALTRRNHLCTHVNRLDEAYTAVAQRRHDLVLLNPDLPDGDGFDLAGHLQRTAPATKTIVFSDADSFTIALKALRCGVVDFVRTPIAIDEFVERVDGALHRTSTERSREERLRRICSELNAARDEISDQVDTLFRDVSGAYRAMNDQIDEAVMACEFRTLLRQELDLEEVLRTTLEYLLGKIGATNAAVFLPDADRDYSLGAYVNYDCPRESVDQLLDHLCGAICPQMADEEEIVAFDDARQFAQWIGLEGGILSHSQIVAFSCNHEGECLAVVVLFRDSANPFDPELAGTLDLLRRVFAEQLARIIRVHHRAAPEWPREPADDDTDYDDFGYGFGGLAA